MYRQKRNGRRGAQAHRGAQQRAWHARRGFGRRRRSCVAQPKSLHVGVLRMDQRRGVGALRLDQRRGHTREEDAPQPANNKYLFCFSGFDWMPQKKSDVAEWLRRQTRIENECNDEREFFSSVGFSRVGSNPAVTGSFFFAIFCGAVALAFYCASHALNVRQIKNVLQLALALSRHERARAARHAPPARHARRDRLLRARGGRRPRMSMRWTWSGAQRPIA